MEERKETLDLRKERNVEPPIYIKRNAICICGQLGKEQLQQLKEQMHRPYKLDQQDQHHCLLWTLFWVFC